MSTFHEDLENLLPDLNRFARALTRNEDDAHDLVQDCIERALKKQALFNDGSSLKSWLFTVMRNIFISQRRRVALDRRYASTIDETPHVQPASQIESVFLNETVEALGRLTPREREAILVLGVHEASQQDVARESAEPVGTLKSRLCRGRAHLRSVMALDDVPLTAVV
jgi:RNA polymerase sigma-70 factor (ECF subfamily)